MCHYTLYLLAPPPYHQGYTCAITLSIFSHLHHTIRGTHVPLHVLSIFSHLHHTIRGIHMCHYTLCLLAPPPYHQGYTCAITLSVFSHLHHTIRGTHVPLHSLSSRTSTIPSGVHMCHYTLYLLAPPPYHQGYTCAITLSIFSHLHHTIRGTHVPLHSLSSRTSTIPSGVQGPSEAWYSIAAFLLTKSSQTSQLYGCM